jgi:hypothetical protein
MPQDPPRDPFWRKIWRALARRRLRMSETLPQPPVTDDDVRSAEELIEKYGWEHLRNKP